MSSGIGKRTSLAAAALLVAGLMMAETASAWWGPGWGGPGWGGYPYNGWGGYPYNGWGGYPYNGWGGPYQTPYGGGWNGPYYGGPYGGWAPNYGPYGGWNAPAAYPGYGYGQPRVTPQQVAMLKNQLGVTPAQESAWNELVAAVMAVKPNEAMLDNAKVKESYDKLFAQLDNRQKQMAENFKRSIIY